MGHQYRVRCQLDGTREVEMDVSAFERVVMNLASNASDAMPEGGDLTIALTDEDAPPREARPAWHAGGFVTVESVEGAGARFDVWLPPAPASANG